MGIWITPHMEIHKKKYCSEGQHTLSKLLHYRLALFVGQYNPTPKNDVANQMGYLWVGLPLSMSSTLPQKSKKKPGQNLR